MAFSLEHLPLAFVVMAAGQSKRLGQSKQAVIYQGESLLVRQLKRCQIFSSSVYCLLGFEADKFQAEVSRLGVEVLVNQNWQAGLGSSIASAVKQLPEAYQAVMIVLVDQWALTEADLTVLITNWQAQPEKIIACSHSSNRSNSTNEGENENKLLSPPIIFPRAYFHQLSHLTGEQGAKPVLIKNQYNVVTVTINNAFLDLDTPAQLAELLNH